MKNTIFVVHIQKTFPKVDQPVYTEKCVYDNDRFDLLKKIKEDNDRFVYTVFFFLSYKTKVMKISLIK